MNLSPPKTQIFHHHRGIFLNTIAGAARDNLLQGDRTRSGSTLTQQFIKQPFFSPKKNLKRKLSIALPDVGSATADLNDQRPARRASPMTIPTPGLPGFTPDLVASVWVGFVDQQGAQITGGSEGAAYMDRFYEGNQSGRAWKYFATTEPDNTPHTSDDRLRRAIARQHRDRPTYNRSAQRRKPQ